MQVETTISDLGAQCNFGNRDPDDVPDGYFQFPHRDDVPEHISRLRIEKGVQVDWNDSWDFIFSIICHVVLV